MTEVAPTALPAPPTNAIEAHDRLGVLSADARWADNLMKGDTATVREFHELSAMAANGDKIQTAMAGVVPAYVLGGIPDSEQVMLTETANHLRDLGLSDGAVEQALRREPLPKNEIDLATAWKMRAMRSEDFVKKFLSGDPEARKQMSLANIVESSQIRSL
jgi:hypothetical protein